MTLSTEQKLQAIIEAQVKGGYELYHQKYWHDLRDDSDDVEWGCTSCKCTWRLPILAILLSPQGLRAAYGNEQTDYIQISAIRVDGAGDYAGPTISRDFHVAYLIVETWISSNGDAAKTIDTAYSLLPKA